MRFNLLDYHKTVALSPLRSAHADGSFQRFDLGLLCVFLKLPEWQPTALPDHPNYQGLMAMKCCGGRDVPETMGGGP